MKTPILPCLAALAAACGHNLGDPGSVPIAPITFDALFVVNGGDDSISVINAETDEIAGTIQLENVSFPHHLYLSPDGSTMAVAVPGVDLSGGHTGGEHGEHGGAVLVLEATTGALRVARRLDQMNHNAAFSPAGDSIWTTQTATPGTVLVLDPVTLETRQSIQVGDEPSEVTFPAAGGAAFVANTGSNSVTVVDPASGEILQTVTVGDAPVGAWPASDGRMYVDNELGESITVIDAVTFAVVATYDLGFTPALVALAPNGELWVSDPDNGQVVFLAAADGSRLGELATGAGTHAIAFSSDGAKAYVTNQTANTVSVIDVAGKTVTKTITVGAKPNGLAYRAQ